jgi:glycosyltransferase involved in cell wall biosynthesis/ubiquinone/menaquinone biosynthesis C-methylase UbiE
LKILFITDWYPTKDKPVSGIFVKEHAKAVSAIGDDIIVIHCESLRSHIKGLFSFEDTLEDSIRTIRIYYYASPLRTINYLVYLWSILRTSQKIIRTGYKPEVIHAHIYSAGVPAVILGKMFRIPVVVSEHSTEFPRKILKKSELWKARFAFKWANIVITVSKSLKMAIENYGIKSRFEIVPNVVDTQVFQPSPSPHPKSNLKHLVVVSLLDLSHKKGIPYLLSALVKVRMRRDDWHLDIVGDGPARREYEHLVEELGLSQRVVFHGIKSKQEVSEFMRQADLFVLPSIVETFSVVVAEALATGVPVLATRCGGPEEFVTDDVGLLVPPGSVDALYEGLSYMLDNLQRYSYHSISQYALELFSPERVGMSLHTIYQSLKTRDHQKGSYNGGKVKPKDYWEHRLSNRLDITTVGQLGLGIYNYWLYKARFRAMHRALRKLNINVSGKSLIDVGVGSGAWIPFWEKGGLSKIVGLDLTTASISVLQKKYPQIEFFQRDICHELSFSQEENFDIVTVFDVLFHIVDDKDFQQAISNLSRLVKKRGLVLISDSFGNTPYGPFSHEYHRTYEHYMNELNRVGLKPVYFEPIFYTMTTPLCASDMKFGQLFSKFIKVILKVVTMIASNQKFASVNYLLGFFLYFFDGIVYRILKEGPGLKILFAYKR